jgi:N-acetyl-anhydromuramyl-L-alanine amidase AmpD
VTAEQMNGWAQAKFGQISYHHIITLDGAVHNTLPDTVRGAHTGRANTGNIGICYVGGMDKAMKHPKDTRTDAQKVALRKLVEAYKARFPGIKVQGHRDWPGTNKACPSFDVAREL